MRGIAALLTLITIGCGGDGGPGGSAGGTGSGGGGSTAGSGVGSGGSTSNGGGTTASTVTLDNATVHQSGSGDWTLHWVFDNHAYPDRVIQTIDAVRLTWNTTQLTLTAWCDAVPWIEQRAVSEVETLDLHIDNASTTISFNCSTDSGDHVEGPALPPPTTSIKIEVKGVLSDATPYDAVAMAPML